MAGKHTPGPWAIDGLSLVHAPDETRGGQRVTIADVRHNREANAHLIAAAPDHAMIGWAMCVAGGRWEPWGDGRGEFCINGFCHATRLDEFGVPQMTDGLRAAIARAKGAAA